MAAEIAKATQNVYYLLLRERLRWRLWLRRWLWQLRLWRYWVPHATTPRHLRPSSLERRKSLTR